MVAGPSTVTALLNSLAMGFKTVAINKKANEVYKVLGAAKAQYDKFGIVLAKARKKVEEAGKTLEDAESRNRIIQKISNQSNHSPPIRQTKFSAWNLK